MKIAEKKLITPYKSNLVNLQITEEEKKSILRRSHSLQKIQLTNRNICDLELLATGAFTPLDNFMGKEDYKRVLEEMRLANGTLFPIPITLSVNSDKGIKLDDECLLTDQFNNVLGLMKIAEIYEADLEKEARLVCGTNNPHHPLVAEMQSWGTYNISGDIKLLNLPFHYDFKELRSNPKQVREKLNLLGKQNVVAFQTRNPLHMAHEMMTKRAAESINGTLLLHPVIGMTQAGDIQYHTRVRSYKKLVEKYYKNYQTLLSLLPLAMRMAGPREAIWHAIIRRNFGANHFIVGRYHASPKTSQFYGEYEAHELMLKYEEEIGVKPILFSEFVYLPDEERFEETSKIKKDKKYLSLSGTDIRKKLTNGENIPEWYLRPETVEILKEAYPQKNKQGFCIWFTGLSGAGKSTIANILTNKLLEHGRSTTLLDGDNVRINLSKGLGFSKEDRDINVKRIAFVASEIVKHNGTVICAAISPYEKTRDECRSIIGKDKFIEVFVDTPLEVCEQRDEKGLYSQARQGKIKNFTGIDDPYEAPANPEIRIKTTESSAEKEAELIINYLIKNHFLIDEK